MNVQKQRVSPVDGGTTIIEGNPIGVGPCNGFDAVILYEPNPFLRTSVLFSKDYGDDEDEFGVYIGTMVLLHGRYHMYDVGYGDDPPVRERH